jgi:hypothetical protein
MITLETLEKVFGKNGASHFNYLTAKNRGGVNNNKGNTFENFYTLYQIAKSFNQGPDSGNVFFSAQIFSFIDDLVIETVKEKKNWYYQIKDVKKLDWNDRTPNSIKDDFKHQYEICSSEGIEAFLRLVVSNKEVHEHLLLTRPDDVGDLIKIINFETALSLNSLIRENQLLRGELIKMCALKNPSADKLEALAAIILGAWDSTDKKRVSLAELLERCYSQNPHYIKGFSNKISGKLADILKEIAEFSYLIEGGFLKWKFGRTDEGVLSYRIGSLEFEQWENDLFNATIKTFEDLEPFLA